MSELQIDPTCGPWIRKMAAFLACLEKTHGAEVRMNASAPLLMSDLKPLEEGLRHPIPEELKEFVTLEAGSIEMFYSCEIDGTEYTGGMEMDVRKVAVYLEDCRSWAEETWLVDYPEDQEQWLAGFPFIRIETRDFIALDSRKSLATNSVLYLSHDDMSTTIAVGLWEFLRSWEQIGYIGPDQYALEPYRDPDTGCLDSDCKNAQDLRKTLGCG